MASEVTALSKAYDLTLWTAERVARFPRAHHYTIGQRLVNTLLDVQELLIEAHYSKEKRSLLRWVNLLLERVRLLVRLAKDLHCLSLSQYEFAAATGRMPVPPKRGEPGGPSVNKRQVEPKVTGKMPVTPVQKKPFSGGGTGPSASLRTCPSMVFRTCFQPVAESRSAGSTGFQPVTGDSSPGGTGFQPVGSDLHITRRNLPHWQVGGSTYFVTFRTKEVALLAAGRQQVLEACRHFDGRRFTLWAAVVLPDHVHLLLRPEERTPDEWWPLPSLLHSIKSFSSNQANQRLRRRGTLWLDESFDRIVRDEEEFVEKWNYIRWNPVREGLCERPEDWDPLYEWSDRDKKRESRRAAER